MVPHPRSLMALLACLFLAGCQCGGEAGGASGSVERLFRAAVAADCDAVERELGGALAASFREHGCEESLDGFADHPLERVVSEAPDGRAHNVMLVRVRLQGMEGESVVRVERSAGVWKVVSL